MNVLSLFDGMSCGQIALNSIGIKPKNYYAAEVDKYAIKVTQANHPDTIQLGDVTKWREWDIDWASIELLIGGSPCQGFSFAGKQLAFDDPRSKLFFVYVEILSHIKSVNPSVKFLLENVKMKQDYLDIISEHLGVEHVFINSALVSAQNRQRYYWANWEFGLPDDKGLVLADILEYKVDHKWIDASNKNPVIRGGYLHFDPNGKGHSSQCNRVNFPHTKHKSLSGTSGGNKHGVALTVDREKSFCIDANYFKGGNLKSYFEKNRRQLVFNDDSCQIYRKLTPIECERLQTVPDNYTAHVSNTQRYKMLGNGWTVDVIAHILNQLPDIKLHKQQSDNL